MANQTLPVMEASRPTASTAWPGLRVFCRQEADVYLEDGTPLYLDWIIEDESGELYSVPAQPGGWFRRRPYDGCKDALKPVTARKAAIIRRLTYADTDDSDIVSALAQAHIGYSGNMWYDGRF